MVNLLVVSHGKLADGLLDAVRLIAGSQEGLDTLSLTEEDSIDALGERMAQKVDALDSGDGVLILVDLLGASPFNVSAQLSQSRKGVEVVTGVNLPMLLEIALTRGETSLAELAAQARDQGAAGISRLFDMMENQG